MVMFSPEEFEGFPLKNAVFRCYQSFYLSFSAWAWKQKVSGADIDCTQYTPIIKCCRYKNFKDLMYRSPNMRKIKFENAHFLLIPFREYRRRLKFFSKTYR